jgi:hypothetical protein
MAAHILLLLCILTAVGVGLVWVFEPAIHYFESVNVNTMGAADYTMKDRYVISVLITFYVLNTASLFKDHNGGHCRHICRSPCI